jgi:hypothetical protein
MSRRDKHTSPPDRPRLFVVADPRDITVANLISMVRRMRHGARTVLAHTQSHISIYSPSVLCYSLISLQFCRPPVQEGLTSNSAYVSTDSTISILAYLIRNSERRSSLLPSSTLIRIQIDILFIVNSISPGVVDKLPC